MRDIKFRIWDKTNKVMIDENTSQKELIKMQMSLNSNNPMRFFYFEDEWYPVMEATILFDALSTLKQDYNDKIEIMQYAGLKDKNGKEIYEGDIVRKKCNYLNTGEIKIRLYKVVWKEEWCAWALKKLGNCTQSCYMYKNELDFCEIVGNIYENPELLEVNDDENV